MNIWDEGKGLPHLLYILYNHNKRKGEILIPPPEVRKNRCQPVKIFIAKRVGSLSLRSIDSKRDLLRKGISEKPCTHIRPY
jgi:hypothetical protein